MGVVAPDLPEEELEPAPQHFDEGVTVTTEHLLEDAGDLQSHGVHSAPQISNLMLRCSRL